MQSMTSWKQLERLEQEASILNSMRHPGVPSLLESLERDSEGNEGLFLVQVRKTDIGLPTQVPHGTRHCSSVHCTRVLCGNVS